ncbi:uncharacterized protein LOC111701609 [Eurytemora carolleeae]|uniref:uncharacterized protein LOC111701609 n=1 Tax=Eurytemora carolleeae TaxID=1294199 RepID=UPI000C781675|nr:uncharacterized protein LOC111701609 [Eurytemora carolleeae]|eukprot:XP_023328740.1 uncharacterized protein LOC111701609 [Eurytemora affinis]
MAVFDFSAEFKTSTLDQICDEDDIELQKSQHRRSLILMEESLSIPYDSSPIAPHKLRQEEEFSDGKGLERLLLERLLLRKELRLRSMQEHLLEQESRIQELETRLAEVEGAPGFSAFISISRSLVGRKSVYEYFCSLPFLLLQALCCLLDLVPASLSLGLAALVHRAGSVAAQGAENYSNERAERAELERVEQERGKREKIVRRRR